MKIRRAFSPRLGRLSPLLSPPGTQSATDARETQSCLVQCPSNAPYASKSAFEKAPNFANAPGGLLALAIARRHCRDLLPSVNTLSDGLFRVTCRQALVGQQPVRHHRERLPAEVTAKAENWNLIFRVGIRSPITARRCSLLGQGVPIFPGQPGGGTGLPSTNDD